MSIDPNRLHAVDAFFRASNYLAAAQLYLAENALLAEPLAARHIKHRLLGHWGTVPGLNLIQAHLNRLIQDTGADVLEVVGVGHGAPGVMAGLYLDGTLGDRYPQYRHGDEGLQRFAHDFSWPGGIPSHLTAMTPGCIHEGGELGYSLAHAYGAVFDNPGLVAVCVVGDGEAETGALATSWHSHRFVDPTRDGAVLPILHLNGYKLSGPTLLARMPAAELTALFRGYGHDVRTVAGTDPMAVHRELWTALDWAYARIREIQAAARDGDDAKRASLHWPMIVLSTLKGWTGPVEVDGLPVEGTPRAHQLPLTAPRTNPTQLTQLDAWLRSYRPEQLFDPRGCPVEAVLSIVPAVGHRLGESRHANGGDRHQVLCLPGGPDRTIAVDAPGVVQTENTAVVGRYLRDVFALNRSAANFRLFCPDETASNRLGAVFDATKRTFETEVEPQDTDLAHDGRVMEMLSEHCCQGWLEGYLQTGRHGVFACYEAFVSIVDSMMFQYAKWQKMSAEISWRKPVASLNYLLTSHVWEQDHNGYSHQGPTFLNAVMTRKSKQVRVYLPPDANCLVATMEHCLATQDLINVVVASKKPMPQWLDPWAAKTHCAHGAGIWGWAGDDAAPDVVLAAAGDVPTREVVAAAQILADLVPQLRVRVVNVVNLTTLESRGDFADAMDEGSFRRLFTDDAPVVFAFHGYPTLIHELIYRRPNPSRFHVHGYREEGSTTTPFDMLVRNRLSRFDLALDALWRAPCYDATRDAMRHCEAALARHHAYIRAHGEDLPEILDWSYAPRRSAHGHPSRDSRGGDATRSMADRDVADVVPIPSCEDAGR